MATLVVAGEVDIDVDVEDYGATHNEERVVPSGMMMEYPSSHPTWKTKKAGVVLLGLLGLTVVVASGGASLFFSSLGTSLEPARTKESFLLQAHVRADDDKCVPASGPWPAGSVSRQEIEAMYNEDDEHNGPFVTCFVFQAADDDNSSPTDACWSHSYYHGGVWDWKPCTPQGYGAGWAFDSPGHEGDDAYKILTGVATCGSGCTRFSSDMPT